MNQKQQTRGQISALRIVIAISAVVTMAIGGLLIATGMGLSLIHI